jgi:hypothetical protein
MANAEGDLSASISLTTTIDAYMKNMRYKCKPNHDYEPCQFVFHGIKCS